MDWRNILTNRDDLRMNNKNPIFYKLSEKVNFADTLHDRRLGLSQIGLLAVLLSVAPETEFKAEDFGKFTYEDVSVSDAYLSDLERCGYVRRVS